MTSLPRERKLKTCRGLPAFAILALKITLVWVLHIGLDGSLTSTLLLLLLCFIEIIHEVHSTYMRNQIKNTNR